MSLFTLFINNICDIRSSIQHFYNTVISGITVPPQVCRSSIVFSTFRAFVPFFQTKQQVLTLNRGFAPKPDEMGRRSILDRNVEKTDSTEWGSAEEAITEATRQSTVTPENEALIRTYHPALSVAPLVQASREASGNMIWQVNYECYKGRAGALPTHVAGREVHVSPGFDNDGLMIFLRVFGSKISRMINPRRMLTAPDIATIRSVYPDAVGVRIYISGVAIVLFRRREELRSAYVGAFPDEIGWLTARLDIFNNMDPATIPLDERNRTGNSSAFLGLRIRLKDGTEAVTTATHAHVRLPGERPIVQWVLGWAHTIKKALSSFFYSGPTTPRGLLANSPLGASLHQAGTEGESPAGIITATHDTPSSIFPYPVGYKHDLSLFTGSNLPRLTSPPGVGRITGWADYEEALDGKPVFVTRLNILGNNATRDTATKPAIMEGTEYFWDKEDHFSVSLLWRTDGDAEDKNLDGDSGTILCLGQPDDETVKAVAFQNYEAPVKAYNSLTGGLDYSTWTMKGGFVLPPDIRESEILSDRLA